MIQLRLCVKGGLFLFRGIFASRNDMPNPLVFATRGRVAAKLWPYIPFHDDQIPRVRLAGYFTAIRIYKVRGA